MEQDEWKHKNIFEIFYKDIYAILSEVSEEDFGEKQLSENLENLEWINRKAIEHNQVIQSALLQNSVLPLKFGTIFYDLDNAYKNLDQNLEYYQEKLKRLENKEEWGIKFYLNRACLLQTLLSDDPELSEIQTQIENSTSGKAYILQKKKEDLIKKKEEAYLHDVFDRFASNLQLITVESKNIKPQPKEMTQKEYEMVSNMVVLLEKEKEEDFFEFNNKEAISLEKSGILLELSGPWAAYHFL